jgi:hypothetical protein
LTPVPLDLPLRPSEASQLANLVLDQAERKPLTNDVRSRIAARGAVLNLETITPYYGSLERDPVHPSAYYLAVDSAQGEPLLLYMALATAPTSSIFYKPLLIGRTRRANGPEMVINAIPFGPADHENLDKFAGKIDNAFLPRPQGSRTAIVAGPADPARAFPAAFDAYRAIWKRTGKNVAAVCGVPGSSPRDVYSAAVWSAVRAGWRQGYSAIADVPAGESPEALRETVRQAAVFSGFSVDASSGDLPAVGQVHEIIRQTRSTLKLGRSFDLELVMDDATPAELLDCLEWLKGRGQAAQTAVVHLGAGLEELAAVARQHQCTLAFRADPAHTPEDLERIARATAGRFHYKVSEDPNSAAQHLIG